MAEENKQKEPVTLDTIDRDLGIIYKGIDSVHNKVMYSSIVLLLSLGIRTYQIGDDVIDIKNYLSNEIKNLKSTSKEIPQAKYVNGDNRVDLVYADGTTYLQTPKGTFVMYDKAKVDSLFKAKEDSIKNDLTKKLEYLNQEKQKYLPNANEKK